MSDFMLGVEAAADWSAILNDAGAYDFYHTAPYNRLAQERGEGRPVLVGARYEGAVIALPLLIRPLSPFDGAPACDATSVYGYPGPVASPDITAAAIAYFQRALVGWARREGVVSVFSRLHPLIPEASLLSGLGEVVDVGPTISIDLTIAEDAQRRLYRANHRRDLRKLREAGFTCGIEDDAPAREAFLALYRQTMNRVSAAEHYLFDRDYIDRILAIPGLALMICRARDGSVAAGAINSALGAIGQYHLGGTADPFLGNAPMKLVFDRSGDWARARGCRHFHLGGGLGARIDPLFAFKAGFSPVRHCFRSWRWIADRPAYAALAGTAGTTASEFFPAYRARAPGVSKRERSVDTVQAA